MYPGSDLRLGSASWGTDSNKLPVETPEVKDPRFRVPSADSQQSGSGGAQRGAPELGVWDGQEMSVARGDVGTSPFGGVRERCSSLG